MAKESSTQSLSNLKVTTFCCFCPIRRFSFRPFSLLHYPTHVNLLAPSLPPSLPPSGPHQMINHAHTMPRSATSAPLSASSSSAHSINPNRVEKNPRPGTPKEKTFRFFVAVVVVVAAVETQLIAASLTSVRYFWSYLCSSVTRLLEFFVQYRAI